MVWCKSNYIKDYPTKKNNNITEEREMEVVGKVVLVFRYQFSRIWLFHCFSEEWVQVASPWLFMPRQNQEVKINIEYVSFQFSILFLTFLNSIRLFKQTINYFNVAVAWRGITFNQVKPISCETNLKQFFAARGRTIKCLIGWILTFGLVFLLSTVKI